MELFSVILGIFLILVTILQIFKIKQTSNNNKIYLLFVLKLICGILCTTAKFIVTSNFIPLIGILLFLYGVFDIINFIMMKTNK